MYSCIQSKASLAIFKFATIHFNHLPVRVISIVTDTQTSSPNMAKIEAPKRDKDMFKLHFLSEISNSIELMSELKGDRFLFISKALKVILHHL